MHISAWCFGLGALIVGALAKLIPYSYAEVIPALKESHDGTKTKDAAFGEALANVMSEKKADIMEALLNKC